MTEPLDLNRAADAIPSPSPDVAPELAGNRYQLAGEIAHSSRSVVLRGWDVDLGRDLAVKVLRETHTDNPKIVRQFIAEAQIGGQLQHPGIVPVYDIGRFGQRPFFTMELVRGQTLAGFLCQRQQPGAELPQLLTIVLMVSQTLAYAHARGVIHCNLEPANIMIGAFGEVQVIDWGLAKVLPQGGSADAEKASRERPQPEEPPIRTALSGPDPEAAELEGTPAYMPPEQANGFVTRLDRRADVFGLGAILCEILTGQPPYVGQSPEEVRRKAANADLADALTRLAGCGADAELLDLTRSCLAPEAGDRPRDAHEVASALTAYLDGVQKRWRQVELAEARAQTRAEEKAKRKRLALALATTVLLALTLGGGSWLWIKADRDARQAQLTRQVHDALNRVTALREQAKAAPVGSAALFGQAREHLQRAVAMVENGPVDAALVAQVQQLQAELDQEEKDRQLLAALDTARLAQAETVAGENRFAQERSVPLFRAAFEAWGLAVGQGEPAAAAARLRQRPEVVRQAAVAALQEWADRAADPKRRLAEPHLDWLRAVTRATEPDEEWTRQLRAALEEKDLAKRRAALEQMAREADVDRMPVRALTRLAQRLREVQAPASAVALLRRLQQRYPADFWINYDLAEALLARGAEAADVVNYLRAAVALRPDSSEAHNNLGQALQAGGRLEEAIACFRQAIELDPKDARAHDNLARAQRLVSTRDKPQKAEEKSK